MRVSTRFMYSSLTGRLGTQAGRLMRTQQQIASGQRLQRPSDDPAGAGRAVMLDSRLSDLQQYRDNAGSVTAMLSATDDAVAKVSESLREARRLSLSGASSTIDTAERITMANQVDRLISQVRQAAETQYAGRYLLSGTNVRSSPLAPTGDDTAPYAYAGNDGQRMVEIADGVNIVANVTGRALFNFDGVGDNAAPDLFSALADLRQQLLEGDVPALSEGLDGLDRLSANCTKIRAEIGQTVQRLEFNGDHLDEQMEVLSEWRSNITATDLAQALVDYSTQELTYQATIALASRVDQPGLFEFLAG